MGDNIPHVRTDEPTASDRVGRVQYPRVKISYGGDGAAVDVTTTAPFPVTTMPEASIGGQAQAWVMDAELRILLASAVCELKKISVHLSAMSDETVSSEDADSL